MISVIDMKEALQSLNEDSNKHINLLHNIYTQATEIKEKLQQAADNGYIKGFIYFPTQRFIDNVIQYVESQSSGVNEAFDSRSYKLVKNMYSEYIKLIKSIDINSSNYDTLNPILEQVLKLGEKIKELTNYYYEGEQ